VARLSPGSSTGLVGLGGWGSALRAKARDDRPCLVKAGVGDTDGTVPGILAGLSRCVADRCVERATWARSATRWLNGFQAGIYTILPW